ncbi:MAG: S-methyl-5-thioribose-1-phosphate isomerase [Pseudobdellovibrionaceae bacterium]|nr:S-methyl-5-thioribose-1-phosphate isomerase [Bdellovibrionales bacterium]USN47375.1 MAG: S-methyl-5-thioribose-1-phosphate isomerase [Pseudobdellovibrionaceae bacterium]
MRDLFALSIRRVDGQLSIIDQTLLPHEEQWVDINSPEDMVAAIKQLMVRGAPLIGVAAALALGDFANKGASNEQFLNAAEELRRSRPTAVNLMWAIDRLLSVKPYSADSILSLAESIFDEDVQLCEKIALAGATLLEDGDSILTHCNTGGLATAGVGTALGIIQQAHRQGKSIHVYVDETRPLLQGGRLTTWELEKLAIPYTLICDNMAASLMKEGKISKAIVGSDRVAANGDFANKIGTYSVAVACQYHGVPFYVAAPYTTVDLQCPSGREIPIEIRRPEEVRGVKGQFGEVIWAPEKSNVYNPAFDVTPSELVSGWIFEQGVLSKDDIRSGRLAQLKGE